jgi:aspartyl-tRNA(Asn)/glutamyl-tRNA(Gln) amidotransferase subunit A
MTSVSSCLAQFSAGRSRESFIDEAFGRIKNASGQGARAFLKVHEQEAMAQARAYDAMERRGETLPPFAGVPISIKDLFDVAGDITTSGSVLLRDAAPAAQDALAVARLKAAGFIPVGRTNMTEFAYSGLGINPHYGTPLNPFGRENGRIPGGSSSGAAVSVTDGMAVLGLGTDTGGSCRIPAALCGLVGFKPTARRVPLDGVMPLSPSLDSVGSLGRTVACCAAADAVLAGEPAPPLGYSGKESGYSVKEIGYSDKEIGYSDKEIRLGIPSTYVFDDVDAATAAAFDNAISRLSAAGVTVVDLQTPELGEIPGINAKGGFSAYEAYAFHKVWIKERLGEYDPRVSLRILKGEAQTADDYVALQAARRSLIGRMTKRTANVDAMVMPTVPIVAPTLAELEGDAEYGRINLLMLRNPTVANLLDGCSISLPCHTPGTAPVGLMLIAGHGNDHRLLALSSCIERILDNS